MKKIIVYIAAVVLIAGCASTSEMKVQVTPLGQEPKDVQDQYLYALPQTVLKVEVTLREVRSVPGPYWEYAEKYLGLKEVVKKKSSNWSIWDVAIAQHLELDPEHYYSLNVLEGDFDGTAMLPFLEQGIVLKGTETINEVLKGNGLQSTSRDNFVRYDDLGVSNNFEERTETMYKTIVTDTAFVEVPVQRTVVEQKSSSTKAKEAANFLLDLRTRRFEMLTGEFEVFPDGEAMGASIQKLDLMEASLEVSAHFHPENIAAKSLKVHGLVMQKELLLERTVKDYEIQEDPVILRHYRIAFADAAYVLWRQHFPSDLLTDKSMEDIFNTHKGSNVTLEYDWDDVLTQQYAMTTLPLGTEKKGASFYDFVVWFVDTMNGVLTYDWDNDVYTLSKEKNMDGTASALDKQHVSDYSIEFPETIRHNVGLLNSFAENAQSEQITQDQAVSDIYRDNLVREPVASDFEDLKELETAKLKTRKELVNLTFSQFPFISINPGSLVKQEGGLWSESIFVSDKEYRVQKVSIDAHTKNEDLMSDYNMPFSSYNVEMNAVLELKEEEWVSLPSYTAPIYPINVEGTIVSEEGEDEDETYQVYQDEETSQDQYYIAIPLWDNQTIAAPFEPYEFSGHFYFPAYKNQRVLVALYFHSAQVRKFLDWRPGARLPMDTQGNHLLLGKKADSQTSIKHTYEDEKPVLNVMRTSDKDTQDITLKEGCMIFETKEDEE